MVSVTDTGTGVAADNLDMIFEPFFTTKEVGKGTGLGLSQAFGFAKQSGGDIEVVSAPGKGATFAIYLPQAEMPRAGDSLIATKTDPETIGGGQRILVVEDNEDVGRFSTAMLEDLGYVIRWVPNAQDALAAITEDEFAVDLVFSDVIMPGMNGVELAIAIRERFPRSAGGPDQRLQRRARRKRRPWIRTDPEALFRRGVGANLAQGDPGQAMKRDVAYNSITSTIGLGTDFARSTTWR